MRLRRDVGALALLGLMLTLLVPQALGISATTTTTGKTATCLDGGASASKVPLNVSLAVVKPIFTSTPYSQYPDGSFYAFYRKYHAATGNVTTNLNWLNTSVKSGMGYMSGWGHSYPLFEFLTSAAAKSCGIVLGKNLSVISDINVTQGALFNSDGSRRFDVAVIGHQEYVTQKEYDQFRLFVASGGRLIAMSSNMFYAKVSYNPSTMFETFVAGHGGFAYNGRTAWHGNVAPFSRNMSGWFGSNYCCFHRFQYKGAVVNDTNPIGGMLRHYFGGTVFTAYGSHEENAVANYTRTSLVATFHNQSGLLVASYIHYYGRGAVFCLCIFGEDTVRSDPSTQYFFVSAIIVPLSSGIPPIQNSGSTNTFLLVAAGAGLVAAVLAMPIIILRRRRPTV